MEMSVTELWKNVLENLANTMGKETVELWLKSSHPKSFDETTLILEVPNKFFIDRIKTDCENAICATIAQMVHTNTVHLEMIVAPHLEQKDTSDKNRIEPLKSVVKEPYFAAYQFNPKYTFDTFVVGKSNRFAQAACEAVAKDPGEAYNPLFIYGGVGLGKTHLLHAIGNYIKQNKADAKVLYITADKFMNELIEAIRHDKNIEFRQKYRTLDVLLIDDIQFLEGKESTQEEFFHTFNTLYEARKQIVISSDSSPKEIPTLEERLRSRFEWGVIADIQPPDLETRIAILRKKAEIERISVPDDVLAFIASKIRANIRELEGSLVRVTAFSLLTKSEITVERAQEILKDSISNEPSNAVITIDLIQRIVAKHFNLDQKDLTGKKRTDAIAFPRQIAMYLARNLTDCSTIEIGDKFGGRDHSTAMYACDKIQKKILEDPYFSALINKITKSIQLGE